MDDLSDPALELIRAKASEDKFSVGKQVKAITKGEPKKYLKELEDHDLISRIGYGKFKVTEKGKKHEYEELQCENCGATFYSRHHAENSGSMKCSHPNLSKNVDQFGKE